MGIISRIVLSDIALSDAELTLSLSSNVTAANGVDAIYGSLH